MVKNFIFVDNYETKCFIGIYPKEKKNKQAIKVSVKLGIKKISETDNLNSTVSYDHIISQLNKIDSYSHINLVETLAKKISKYFEDMSNINYIKVKIVKKNILKNDTDVGYILEKKIS